MHMPRRSITAAQREWLSDELTSWQAEAIVTDEQRQRILDQYESTMESADRQRSRGVFTLMAVSGFLVALAVLLLIGYNWQAMPVAVKLIIIFGTLLGTYASGFFLRYTKKALIASELVFFLGCMFYGAGIFLIAQIFNLNAHYPDGVWWWAVGVLPFALCLDTVLLHVLLVALLAIWAGVEILNFNTLGAWLFGRWANLPNGAYTLPLLALPGLIWAYRKRSPLTVGLYAPLLAWWVVLQLFAWRLETNPTYFIGAVGALFLVLSESHRPGSLFAIPYRFWGVMLVGGALIPLSFHAFNKEMFRDGPSSSGLIQMLAIVALTLLTIGVTWLARRRLQNESVPFMKQARAIVRRQVLPCAMLLLMVMLALWDSVGRTLRIREQSVILPTVLANIAMISCALWLIVLGLREDRGRPFAAGVFYFLLWTILRYADLFGEFGGMLGAALMFFLCGAVLFGVALFWRKRKEVHHA
jgi:uncharacterized membrane protein